MKTEIIKNMCGGEGEVTLMHVLDKEQLNDKCRLYARITINPGSTLGYHVHHNESDTYFIISGTAEFDDNGVKRIVKAGDVTYTPDGCGHGLKPIGDEPLVFMALVLLD